MLVTFKSVTQESFQVELDAAQTIEEVKKRIADKKGKDVYPVEGTRLIYNGQILNNHQCIRDIQLDPLKFVVIMASKDKASERTQTATARSLSASPNTLSPVTAPAELNAEQENTLKTILAMGYPRDTAIRALRAADFNAERAVEYLISGIPDVSAKSESQKTGGKNEQANQAGAQLGGSPAQGIAFFREVPQFEQIRQFVRQNPAMIGEVIQEIGRIDPELMQLIRNNEQEFIEMLNAPANPAEVPAANRSPGGQPQQILVELTADERAAVDRLNAMGFPNDLVMESFLACDKKEDLAVNYILARMEEAAADIRDGNNRDGGGKKN